MNSKTQNRIWDFNGRLFLEGLRQLKTIGILFLIVFSLAALFIPLGNAISTLSNAANPAEISRELVNLNDLFPMIYLLMFTMAPIMVLAIFYFLNQRKASDFYHALPVSRAALFISFFAAILVWLIAVTVISAAVSVLTALCFPQVFQVNFSSILQPILSSLAGSLLITSGIALAMCITGSLFNNLLIGGILLIVPRLMFLYIGNRLASDIAVFSTATNNPFFNLSYHIPLQILKMMLAGDSFPIGWSGVIYTAIIGFLYFLIAIFLFRGRRSEAAGYAAATPVLQTVYRLLITFLVTLIPVAIILECIQDAVIDAQALFHIIVSYAAAAVVFFAYELITTKKIHRLLKIAPTFGIVLVLNAILVGGILFAENRILAYRPAADDITAVSLQSYNHGLYQDDYFAQKTSTVRIEDAGVKKLVSEVLANAAKDNRLPNNDDDTSTDYLVTLYEGGVSRQRVLRFSQKQQETILRACAANNDYRAAYTLPELSNSVSATLWALNTDQVNTLYRLMREESASLTFEQLYQLLAEGYYPQSNYVFTEMGVSIDLDGQVFRFDVPLASCYFPKTYNRYLAMRTENTKDGRAAIRAAMETSSTAQEKDFFLEAYSKDNCIHVSPEMTQASQVDFLKKLLPYLSDETPTMDDDFCKISYTYFDQKSDSYESVEAFFVLKKDSVGDMSGFEYLQTTQPLYVD